MTATSIPDPVDWRNGMVLEPKHFQATDRRTAALSHVSALTGEPWPWGFLRFEMDATALASFRLLVDCAGVFPDGQPFRCGPVTLTLPESKNSKEGESRSFLIARSPSGGEIELREGDDAPSETTLPVARLTFHGDVWNARQDWSPPALLVEAGHPLRSDLNQQLGSLAAIGAGFMATLRLPGAEERPAARMMSQVAAELARGVGVMEALLAAPTVPPGRLGMEALRLALGVRSAAGVFQALDEAWNPADQRGSMRRLLYEAEAAASGVGLPFRANLFQPIDGSETIVAHGAPEGALLLAIEASSPADLMAARTWFDGAALAAPDRIQEALTRRVAGCARNPVDRDPRIGVSSGPLLGLYRVDADMSWRGSQRDLALAAKSAPPPNTSFSLLIPEDGAGASPGGAERPGAFGASMSPAPPPAQNRGRWNGGPS